MDYQKLESTARALVARGKGILAADESLNSTARRFARLNIPHTPENRRLYRELMFTTPGLEEFITGVIMFDETIRQAVQDGTPFPDYLLRHGILPGIKVDAGFKDMAGFPGEKITEGLDGLRERLAEYVQLGAQFAKWRAVITVGAGIPTQACLAANAHALARYAALCQEAGVVPIVEPDVLLAGDYSLERGESVTTAMLAETFYQLHQQGVFLEGILLKPNMVLPGKECPVPASDEDVACATLRALRRTVPAAVPGIVFLSGGQGSEPATTRLNAINRMGQQPWELSFSYLRALADPAFEVWSGVPANFEAAQQFFYSQAKQIAAARQGRYDREPAQS